MFRNNYSQTSNTNGLRFVGDQLPQKIFNDELKISQRLKHKPKNCFKDFNSLEFGKTNGYLALDNNDETCFMY